MKDRDYFDVIKDWLETREIVVIKHQLMDLLCALAAGFAFGCVIAGR